MSVYTAITVTMIPRTSVQSNLATGHIVDARMPCQWPFWWMLSRHCVWYWLCPIVGAKTGRVHRARCARLTHSSKVTIPMRNLDPFVIPCAHMSLPHNWLATRLCHICVAHPCTWQHNTQCFSVDLTWVGSHLTRGYWGQPTLCLSPCSISVIHLFDFVPCAQHEDLSNTDSTLCMTFLAIGHVYTQFMSNLA